MEALEARIFESYPLAFEEMTYGFCWRRLARIFTRALVSFSCILVVGGGSTAEVRICRRSPSRDVHAWYATLFSRSPCVKTT